MHIHRKTLWAVPAAMMLLLTACGQQAESPSGGNEGSQPSGSADPSDAGQGADAIVMATDGLITTLSNAASDVPTSYALPFIYNSLYQYDLTLSPVPDLAADLCEVTDDQVTWTCTLRDATFHNGDPVTADDVVYIFQLAQSENCQFSPSLCLSPFLESVQATDERTIAFVLLKPYAPFSTVILPGIGIESRAVIEAGYEEFTGDIEAIDSAAAAEAQAAIDAAATPDEGDPDQDACETAAGPAEAILGEAENVDVPSRDDFNTGGENEDEFVPCDYAAALSARLGQVITALKETGIDAVAAAYPLLSFNTEPIGTGPWMCEPDCLQPGESLTLTAFDDHFGGAPETDTIVIPIITDDVAGANAVKAGEVDWKYALTPDSYALLAEDPNIKVAEYPAFSYYALQYNLREDSLFGELSARKAVQSCIDKAATVEAATDATGIPIEADIPPASWAYNPDLEPVARDVGAAIQLLRDDGWTVEDADGDGVADGVATRDGEEFSTQVYVRAGQPDRIRFMELVRDQVAECGIAMEVIEGDFATVLLPLLTYPHIPPNADRPFDAYFGGWTTGYDPDPFSLFHSSQCTNEENPSLYNYVCFQNERADELIDQGLAVSDQAERAAIYQEFEQIMYDEQPYLFAWSPTNWDAMDVGLLSTEGDLELGSPTWPWRAETLYLTVE